MEICCSDPVAVVGGGTMGVGIAQVAASAGHSVTILDRDPAALDRGRAGLATSLDASVAKGRLDYATREAIWNRIRWSTDLALAAGSKLVIEAIVESLEVKRHLFGGLARVVSAHTLLASNTSSLGIGAIAEQLALRGRFLGLHFFNPVPVMKLVEIVAGPDTDPAVVDAAVGLMKGWGKQPVRVRDVAGFIVNRVARPYYAEGFAALGEGIAPAAIDAALTEAAGFRMGPLALADLIGHDVNYAVASSVHDAGVGRSRFRPQEAQAALVDRGKLGRKSGQGVYDYSRPLPTPDYVAASGAPARLVVGEPGLLQPLVDAAAAKGILIIRDAGLPRDAFSVDGTLVALGDGRLLADRPGVDVLLDHARDFATASTLVLTAASSADLRTAAAFLPLIGRRALEVPDRPGQLVLRTLAQMANAAADTDAEGIASPDDVETAMRFGANHPEGPLAWVRRTGADRVRIALDNITQATGDGLYAPAAQFGTG